MTHDVTVLEPDDLRAADALFMGAVLHAGADDETWTRHTAASYSPGRTLGVHHGGTLVATATSFRSAMAVPGGAALAAAAVTRVGVRADHTRRGLLTAMMRTQLQDVAAGGEVLALLHATEARIYGRFGYGVATRGRTVRVRRSGQGWRSSAPTGGTVRLLAPADAVAVLAPLHDRLAARRAGGITRPEGWWSAAVARRIDAREPIVAIVHTGPDGDDGFALAVVGGGDRGFTRVLRVDDMHAAGVDATTALWRFLLGVDLVGAVEAELRPLDEPLELLLADPRDATVTAVDDETWVRLVDVPAALAARSYGDGEPVLLAVRDTFLEANNGVYRIGDGTAERAAAAPPDLACDVSALAMAYLGDRTPSELAATGWWTAHDPKALARADTLFATGAVPWCGTFF